MNSGRMYEFPAEKREALESLRLAIAAYQFVDNKVVTLLVSDGMCELFGADREQLINNFNKDMFAGVHPDDVEALAKLGIRYATKEGPYDIVYRNKKPDSDEYRYIHAVSKFHGMEDGSRVAITEYNDISSMLKQNKINALELSTPISKFMDESTGPLAVVSRKDKRLLYFNKPIVRMLDPKVVYDSNMTFYDYFYSGNKKSMSNIFDEVDIGPRIIIEPGTGRNLEVNVISTTWNDEPAYVAYFYEQYNDNKTTSKDDLSRERRMTFNDIIYSGESNGLEYDQIGHKSFIVWNLTNNTTVTEDGHHKAHEILGNEITYDEYIKFLASLLTNKEDKLFLNQMSRQAVMMMFENGNYPKTKNLIINTTKGKLTIKIDVIMMRSPDAGDIYLKLQLENITDKYVRDLLIKKMVQHGYNFIAYIDVIADQCKMIENKSTNTDQQDFYVKFTDYYKTLSDMIGLKASNCNELIEKIIDLCRNTGNYQYTFNLSKNEFKRINLQLLDSKNKVFFISSSDISEILLEEKAKEDALKKAKEQAVQANEEKSYFLTRTSHDLRTPAGAVISLAEFGIDECEDTVFKEYFRDIHDSASYMLEMLNDVLDLEKLETGKIRLVESLSDVKDIARQTINIVLPKAYSKNINLDYDLNCLNDKYVLIDERRIQQVLLNVIINAVKYTPEGGTVSWKCKIVSKDGKQYFVNEISDTGVGMSESFQKHLFEPYAREYNKLSSAEGGSGLGLAIVKKLIDAMHGEIEVKSELNKGSSFLISLPFKNVSEDMRAKFQQGRESGDFDKYDFNGTNVLVCEDNKLNQQIIKKILKNANMTVDVAENGKDGIMMARENHYDIILMDIMMPIMGGLEATREIRKSDTEIPIIALSANAYTHDIQKSINAGMDAHISKPIDVKQLFQTIAKQLDKHNRRNECETNNV